MAQPLQNAKYIYEMCFSVADVFVCIRVHQSWLCFMCCVQCFFAAGGNNLVMEWSSSCLAKW